MLGETIIRAEHDGGTINAGTGRFWVLFLLFSLELTALMVARLPQTMRFENFAFCDQGANLTLQHLIANGYRPGIDFGYHYGLLPVLLARGWFAIFGASPLAYQLAMLACNLLFALALAKVSIRLRVHRLGLAFLIVTLGIAFQSSYPNLAQAIEAVLLSLALAAQAGRSRSLALALATASIFAKPSMGYVYSFVLVMLIVRDQTRKGFNPRRLLPPLAPAAITFLALAMILGIAYGGTVLLDTVFPLKGAAAYRSLNFGLLGSGRAFWDLSGKPSIQYFVSPAGFWIASGVFLVVAGLLLLRSVAVNESPLLGAEIIVTCAILHLAFLAFFFGNQWSWIYYSYLPIIGCAIALNFGPTWRLIGFGICVVAILSWSGTAYWLSEQWQTTSLDASAGRLWTTSDESIEWTRVLRMTHNKNTAVIDGMGAAELLFPDLESPVSLFLVRGLMTPSEIARKNLQLSTAEMVIAPIQSGPCDGVAEVAEFNRGMKNFERLWTGQHFEVFERSKVP